MAIIRDQSPSVNREALEAKRRSLDEAQLILSALLLEGAPGHVSELDSLASRDREGMELTFSLDMALGLLATTRAGLTLDEDSPAPWLQHLLNVLRNKWASEPETASARSDAWHAASRDAKLGGLTFIALLGLMVEVEALADEEAEFRRLAGPVAPVEVFHFDGDALQVVVPEGEPATRENVRVVIRHVSEALGVDFSSQLRNLKHAAWACVVEMTTQVGGQSRSVSTIPLKALPMWLARLNPGKVRPELRAKITRYQCEAADALAAHFLGTPAIAPVQPDWRVLRERRLSAKVLADLARASDDQDEARHMRAEARRLLSA